MKAVTQQRGATIMQGKRFLVLVFVLLFLVGVPGAGYCYFETGNDLVRHMREYEKGASDPTQEAFRAAAYMGYITGVADTVNALSVIILEGKSVGQLCAVVAKYLKANPEKWHKPAVGLVIEAFREAFPKEQ